MSIYSFFLKKKLISKIKIFFRYKDVLGNIYFIKRLLIFFLGYLYYNKCNKFKELQLEGTENIKNLPDKKVLFISNHQTYFVDVFAMFHVFFSVKNGFIKNVNNPIYLFNPKLNIYYVAARETMKNSLLSRILIYLGGITIKRVWKQRNKKINRLLYISEINLMGKALNDGWLITFPQGTTKAFSPGRRGIVHIIKKYNPIVVPIVINGFQDAYYKKGIKIKKKGVVQKMKIKNPMNLNIKNENVNNIMDKIMDSIEQSNKYKN